MGRGDLEIWLNHFEYHALHRHRVLHGLSDILKPRERRLIAGSMATFQLGEQSQGQTLLRAAERCARAERIPHLVRIIELLIREEHLHASLLRSFLQDHGMPLKRADWTDRVFRRMRRLGGLQLYLYVLMSAELVGNVYYRALESVTDCERLRVLCRTIVADELAHVGFESQLLFALRARHTAPVRWLARSAHIVFFVTTVLVVWRTHASVLRHAGYSARRFVRSCMAQYAFYLQPARAGLENLQCKGQSWHSASLPPQDCAHRLSTRPRSPTG